MFKFKWLREYLTGKRSKSKTPHEVRTITITYHCHCCNRVSHLPLTKQQCFGCSFCSAVIMPTTRFSISDSMDESTFMLHELTQVLQIRWKFTIEELAPPLPSGKVANAFKKLNDEQFKQFCDYLQGRFDNIMYEIWNEAGNLPMLPQDMATVTKADLSSETDESEHSCCICTDDLKEGEDVLKLPCGHLYHENCIKKWFVAHSTCPVCRKFLRSTIF